MNDSNHEAIRVIREGLSQLPPHPIRGRWIAIARWKRGPWAAVWLVVRRKKTFFNHLQLGSYLRPDGWIEPSGGGGGGDCPPFVDPDTRRWRRPVEDPWIGRHAYLIPSGMSRLMFDRLGLAPSSLRIWSVCAIAGVAAVRVEVDEGETYTEPVASPIGAFTVGIDDHLPSARLVPLDEEGREFANGWAMAV